MRTVFHQVHSYGGRVKVLKEKIGSSVSQTPGVTEDTHLLNGETVHLEEQLLKAFKAVSEVFPNDALPFDGLEQYRNVRRALKEVDSQSTLKAGPFSSVQSLRERNILYRQARELVEADFRLSRKQRLASMALSQDWSGVPSYLLEGISMWKSRQVARYVAMVSGMKLHRVAQPKKSETSETPARSTVKSSSLRALPATDLQLRSTLKRLGISVLEKTPMSVIRTGSLSLDEALGVGGFPLGRIVEVFGRGGTGKTTLALSAAANAQRLGASVAYVDTEHKIDLNWARANGLRIDEALIMQGTEAKAVLDLLLELIRSNRFALVVVDSLSALVPGSELEERHVDFSGELDQLFSRALPRIAAAAGAAKTCVLLLDQIRHDHEVVFGRDKVSTGGEAVVHYSSIRLELTRMMAQKEGNNILGYGVKGTVLKSCVGAPFRVAQWGINFERGMDSELELIEQGLSKGIIVKQPAALTFEGELLGSNSSIARTFLIDHPEVAARVETRLRAALRVCSASS